MWLCAADSPPFSAPELERRAQAPGRSARTEVGCPYLVDPKEAAVEIDRV